MLRLEWVAHDSCFNKKTELFLSEAYYYPGGMVVTFSKNCQHCVLSLVAGESANFYEVVLDPKSVGKKVTITIAPR